MADQSVAVGNLESAAIPALAEFKALAKLIEIAGLSSTSDDLDGNDLFAIGTLLNKQHDILFDCVNGLIDARRAQRQEAANG